MNRLERKTMTNLVAIDNKIHKNVRIDSNKAELHGAELHMIPVVLSEFVNLAVQYPIVLTKNGDTGQFICIAMLGFKPYENLFWQNGQWQGLYLPLQIQRQPFFVGNVDVENSEQGVKSNQVVCVDFDSPTIVENCHDKTEGEPLFTENGVETEFFQQAKARIAQLLQGEVANQHFIDKLKELDLLQPLSVEISFVNQEKTRLNGLYTIDKEKLAALTEQKVFALHQAGFLEAIYTMIASLGQIYALIDKKNKRLEEK